MDFNKLFRTQWDRTSAVILSLVGLIFLIAGYIGVSGTPYLAGQAPYILSGGIGGVFFLGYGATLWISADLRDEWRKLDRIEEALKTGQLRWTEDGADAALVGQQTGRGFALPPEFADVPPSNGHAYPDEIDLFDTVELAPLPAARAPRSKAPAARRASSNGRSKATPGSVRGA